MRFKSSKAGRVSAASALGFAFSMLLLSASALALPEEYARNPDIRTQVELNSGQFDFRFGFRDPMGEYAEWAWSESSSRIENGARAFGLPARQTQQYFPSELAPAGFKLHPELGLMPDYTRLVGLYRGSVRELHRQWKEHTTRKQLVGRQALEALLVFLQDFPYGRVPPVVDGLNIAGLFVPSQIFKNGWADCDSKSLLMAIVLSYEPEYADRTAMILVPGHALLGIEMQPSPYDETYRIQNRTLVVVEPTGLGRTPLGRRNSPYSQVLAIDWIRTTSAAPTPAAPDPNTGRVLEYPGGSRAEPPTRNTPDSRATTGPLRALEKADCGAGGVLVDTRSPGQVRVQTCYTTLKGAVVKNGPQLRYGEDGLPAERIEYQMGTLKP